MPEAPGSATFIRSTGPGAHQETRIRQLGRLRVGSSPWPGASNETSFLVSAGGTKNKRSKSIPASLLRVLGSPCLRDPNLLFQFSDGLWATAAVPHPEVSEASCLAPPPSTFCPLPSSSAIPLHPSLPFTTSLSPHFLASTPHPLLIPYSSLSSFSLLLSSYLSLLYPSPSLSAQFLTGGTGRSSSH